MGKEDGMTLTFDENRRKHRRHDVHINVELQDESQLKSLYATDLSRGGLFLATRSEMKVGQKLDLVLEHPLTEENFAIESEVVNVRHDDAGAVKGYGLSFLSFDEERREALLLFVEGVVELEPELDDLELIEDVEEVEPPKPPPPPPPPPAAKKPERAAELVERGRKLAGEGNLTAAAHVLSRATSLEPTNEKIWAFLREVEGQLEAQRQQPAEEDVEIDVDLSEVEASPPESTERRKSKLLFESAREVFDPNDVEDAVYYLEKAIAADETFLPSYFALVMIMMENTGDLAEAARLCRRVLELAPKNKKARSLLETIESKQ